MKKRVFQNILIFGHSNIGDVCYDLVVAEPLRRAFPKARISFVTSAKARQLAEIVPGINEVIVFDKHGRDKGMFGYLLFIKRLREKKIDLAVILRDIQMHYFLGVNEVLKIKKEVIRSHDRHVAEKYLILLEHLGIERQMPQFDFRFYHQDEQFARELYVRHHISAAQMKVGIMPFAGWLLKCWSAEKWNVLIHWLTDELKAAVFVFGKTGENNWEKEFLRKLSPHAISLVNESTITQTMTVISRLDVFIGLDTSFLHLSSCMGIPTVGIYGATNQDFIYPLFHKQNVVISGADLQCMPCYPGQHGGSCGVKDNPGPCMEAITPEEVIAKVRQVITDKNM